MCWLSKGNNIVNCRTQCLKEVAEIIVPLHIYSGSDATTAFLGHGKATNFDEGISMMHTPFECYGKVITSHPVCS